MKIASRIISLLLVVSIVLPLLAEARAGSRYGGGGYSRGQSSFGGSYRSGPRYNQGGSYNYRPRSTYSSPYSTPPAYAAPTARATSGSFFSGLLSGVLGAYLYNKIFHSDTTTQTTANSTTHEQNKASAASPETKEGGGFWRIILLLIAVYFIYRILKKRRRGQNRPSQFSDDNNAPRKMNLNDFLNLPKGPSTASTMLNLTRDDERAFEDLLIKIQNAWSEQNLPYLQTVTTPEMYDSFADILHENQQHGIKNNVSQVKLQNLELLDSWQESNDQIARVALTWSALDYAVNISLTPNEPGYLVDGNMNEPTTVTEIWTFKRSHSDSWVLAEIQQG